MKFSASVTLQYETPFSAFSVRDWREGLDWMKRSGLDGAELCISHYQNIDVPLIRDELDQRSLGCSTLSTGQARSLEGLSFTGVSETVIERTRERYRQHIDAASVLGSKVTIGLMRGIGSEMTRKKDLDELREAMMPVVEYADRKGVTLILEGINRYETTLLNSSEEVCDFIENDLGNPSSVGVLWDLFHANIEDADLYGALRRLGKHLKHIHVADSNRSFPGYGHMDLDSILKAVKGTGYEDYISFECFNRPSVETVLQQTGPWVDHIRGL